MEDVEQQHLRDIANALHSKGVKCIMEVIKGELELAYHKLKDCSAPLDELRFTQGYVNAMERIATVDTYFKNNPDIWRSIEEMVGRDM